MECKQSLLLLSSSEMHISQILGEYDMSADAYASFLRSSLVSSSLHDDLESVTDLFMMICYLIA